MSGALVVPPVEQDRWHKLFKFAPLVIILMYMRTRADKPVTQAELADEFCIDRKTAAGCLRELSTYGMVAHVDHNNGYLICEGGQQMLLDLDAGWGKNGHLPLKESLKDFKDLKIKERKERKNRMGIFWTSPEGLSTEQILAETGTLFGKATISFGLTERDPSLTMALVAHAYDQRARLKQPQIFVYRRLQRNEPADKKYMVDPLSYLPNAFLHVLGLAELAVVELDAEDGLTVDCEEESSAAIDVAPELARAWDSVLELLRGEMPRAAFTTWVADTHPRGLVDGVLQVVARTGDARDWLESRLRSTVERALVGILSQSVMVEFVSAETGG